ncbi:polysaccharide pyruvyl transferase family protein [Anaerosporobacter sp.]|uniref:polysaccharide pyruvyl transferase family protein n=1 Tax=Anaerosporobacter sp. TaxID=1872529 RepID=UPI00289F1084|nr:polysaccharide pyruvyl transferase family protein [Anaerosporobacter sp.]
MKVLHLASFNGNIGDHANHSGFRRCFSMYLGEGFEFDKLEIREFYRSWGIRRFDSTFVDYVNQYDLLIIGGGNYFELCWDYSQTGTTIDLSIDLLKQIKPKIIFNGMGIDDKNGTINPDNIKKFKIFFDYIVNSNKILLSVRNDGSKEIAQKYYGKKNNEKILRIPDGGFFVKPKEYEHVEIPQGKKLKLIAINLAGDSENIRFSKDGGDGRLTKIQFVNECADSINEILSKYKEINLVMTAHIVKDYEIIVAVLNKVKDFYVRTRITIAPCVNGDITDGDYIFDIYRKVDLVIGMRYHANICAIAVGTPTIGIVNFSKHKELYRDISMEDRIVASDEKDFTKRLVNKIDLSISNLSKMKQENKDLLFKLTIENELYFKKIKELLND